MKEMTDTKFMSNTLRTLKRVANKHNPILIRREKGNPVVLLSLKGYEAIEKLIHIMEDPLSYTKLLKALNNVAYKN